MAKRILTSDLSVKGIENLKKQLLNYSNNIIKAKLKELVKELMQVGIPVIETNMENANYSYDEDGIQSGTNTLHKTRFEINSVGNKVIGNLILEGEQVIFIEFGAGVYYNESVETSPHPQGQQFGFLIGTYGQGFGARQVWGYYDDSGKLVLTHGIEAQMPMYKASQKIIADFVKVAERVFSR